MRKTAPDPRAEGLAEIDAVWGPRGWFLTAHEAVLRDDPDVRYHAQKRAQVQAIAEARVAELRAALLARTRS